MLTHLNLPSPLEPLAIAPHLDLRIKRDDTIHPIVSGNKWRKLAGFFAQLPHPSHIVTFGGAYSNHLAAAAACINAYGHTGTFIVRGQELNEQSSAVLQYCHEQGMRLYFIERSAYQTLRKQHWQPSLLDYTHWQLPVDTNVLPEGGSGAHNRQGCAQLWQEISSQCSPAHIWLPAGTGATCRGLLHAMPTHATTEVTAVSAVKNAHNEQLATQQLARQKSIKLHWIDESTFGGFAKSSPPLLQCMHEFQENTGITIDPIYNAKLWWHLKKRISNHPNHRPWQPKGTIVWLHTGGLREQHVSTHINKPPNNR